MATVLQKITTRAKAIRKANPRMEWKAAIKKASAELKGKSKPAKKKAKKRSAVRPGVKVKETHTVTKTIGRVKRSPLTSARKSMRNATKALEQAYGDLAVKKLKAKGVRAKKKIQKQMSQVRAKITLTSKKL